MLILSIIGCWFAILGLVVALCQACARADAEPVLVITEMPCAPGQLAAMRAVSPEPIAATRVRGPLTLDGARVRSRRLAHSGR